MKFPKQTALSALLSSGIHRAQPGGIPTRFPPAPAARNRGALSEHLHSASPSTPGRTGENRRNPTV